MPETPSDAVDLAARIRAGELTAREAAEHAILRIEKANPALNAVIATRFEEALAEIEQGLPDGPLRGVPTLIKDLGADVAGLPATRGSRLFQHARAQRDSALVARYRRAGMAILGTTNTPEFGKNTSTEPVLHGPTQNPWRRGYSPGGSSGGAAAAVAGGMVPAAHGSDGGGSIRIPASMCGLFGLKPSRGRVSGAPHPNALASPLAVHHALTWTVRDSAALLDVAAGGEPGDAYAAPTPRRPYVEEVGRAPGALRIGWTATAADGTTAAAPCARAVEQAANLCAELGHEVEPVTLDYDAAQAMRATGILMGTDLAAAVDGRLAELGRQLRDDDLEPFTHAMLEHARSLPGTDVVWALRCAQQTGWELARSCAGYDLLLTPTLAAPPPELGVLDTTDVSAMYELGGKFAAFTGVFNLTGQPAMSVPFGSDTDGLPIGVQFVAPLGGEDVLLRLGAQLEEAAPWPVSTPEPG